MTYFTPMEPSAPPRLIFPCDYPIKVMVRAQPGVRTRIDAIVERHAGPLAAAAISERASSQQRFIGITYVIRASGHAQIAALFAELKQCPDVLVVL